MDSIYGYPALAPYIYHRRYASSLRYEQSLFTPTIEPDRSEVVSALYLTRPSLILYKSSPHLLTSKQSSHPHLLPPRPLQHLIPPQPLLNPLPPPLPTIHPPPPRPSRQQPQLTLLVPNPIMSLRPTLP